MFFMHSYKRKNFIETAKDRIFYPLIFKNKKHETTFPKNNLF